MNNLASLSVLLARRCVSLLNASPPVLASYESDFAANLPAFAEFAREHTNVAILLQLGYEHESPDLADKLAAAINAFRDASPKSAKVIVLCNSSKEVASLGARNLEVRLIQQNAFLDDRRYRPLPAKKRYDAAYIARLTPCKRHELIPENIASRLLLLGCATKIYESERPYADMVFSRYSAAHIIRTYSGAKLSQLLAPARCGLVLSAREGASFCSSEYLLCGLPVVDTPAMGGRETLYPEEFVKFVESTPEAVGSGIEYFCRLEPNPWRIRAAWLDKARPHREAFTQLMQELTGRTAGRPPHKLGIRTPHPDSLHSHAIQLWNFFRAIVCKN